MYSATIAVLSAVIALLTSTEQSVNANTLDKMSKSEHFNTTSPDSTQQFIKEDKK